ncbi:YihY/virulence factor BrkB family protein [Chitinophaga agri]|uniref:YihY/virulence factor BrkB family protein n=1 Tax=Chitinophaga agri TaxID=2703787 RepID=A0A6B9ZA08_9BACT|nr:YihY/virulence factor BrkB family protein [Chitinophaga agri]QHS58699.1 YihY/virulence factor BrkB family protein [Chitinophaga agri]
MSREYFKSIARTLRVSFQVLQNNDPLRLAGATAFFASFALPPILLILLQVFGLLFDRKSIGKQLVGRLAELVGRDSAQQVVITLRGFRGLAQTWPVAIILFVFLLFVATTLLKVIRSSLNQVWMIRIPVKESFGEAMLGRLRSLIVIGAAGILFLASLMAESAHAFLGNYVNELFPSAAFVFSGVFTQLVSLLIVTAWFGVLFRYLPDARPTWKVALSGALLTGVLFSIGKLILHRLLYGGNIGILYGASASAVLLMLFIFYSAIIFYYGAAFTKVWSEFKHRPMQPLRHATFYELADVEVR